MAGSLQVTNIPDKIRAQYDSQLQDLRMGPVSKEVPKQYQRNSEDIQLLKFPSTKNILWDHVSTGNPVHLSISCYRKPKLCIAEKVLRFAKRHLESLDENSCGCTLVGSLNVDDDGEGILFNVERLDPAGDVNRSTNHASGDVLIPFTVQRNTKERGSSMEDYIGALQLLRQRCCSKDPIELGNFLLTKGWCSVYGSGDNCVHHLEFDVVTMATEIEATPINPVPVVPTALSKNLSGPMSISHMQGTPKTGYLTMDHTRKLLLVLESDPKVISLPIVGIWVSGVSYAYSPYVWACCLRYLHNSSLQDRVCVPPEPFLLVLYNPTHSKPEFYECSTARGTSKMTFDFFTGYEAVNVSQTGGDHSDIVEVDLNPVQNGLKKDVFDAALAEFSTNLNLDESVRSVSPEPASQEDITPRSQPAPHKAKLLMAESMVPEVSLFFGDGDTTSYAPNIQHPHNVAQGLRPKLQLPSSTGYNQSQMRPMLRPQCSQGAYPSHPSVPRASAPASVNNAVRVSSQPPSVRSGPAPASMSANTHSHGQRQSALSQAYSSQSSSANSGMPAPNQHHCRASSEPSLSSQYPGQQAGYGMVQSHPTTAPVLPHGVQPQFPSTALNTHSSRPGFCNCPSCPKPAPQSNMPHQYEVHRGQGYPPPRQVYPQSSGPLPPQFSQPRYPQNGQMATGHPSGMQSSTAPYPASSQESYPQSYPAVVSNRPPANPGYPQYQQQVESHANKAGYGNPPRQMVPQQTAPHTVSGAGFPAPVSGAALPQGYPGQHQNNTRFPANQSEDNPHRLDEKALSPRTPVQGEFDFARPVNRGEHVQRNNNSDNSARSSDDSGLSVTPEKHNSPANNSPKNGAQAASNPAKPLAFSPTAFNWEKVPPEVYQLLLAQDKQLKELQAQIQLLTAQQALQTLNNSTEKAHHHNFEPRPKSPQKCSTAVNTSMQYRQDPEQVSACMQTSPQKLQASVENSQQSSASKDLSQSSGSGSGCEGRTPMEIRHRGRLPMNSTQKEEMDLDMSQGELIALMNNMHDKTIDSVQSEMIVDLPSFQSSPSRSPQSQYTDSTMFNTSPRSPISASMCEQQPEESDSEEEEGSEGEPEETTGADNPEYYSKLMDNIKKLLSQNTTEDMGIGLDGYQGDVSSDPSTPTRLEQQNIQLGEQLQSFFRYDQTPKNTDTTFIPKINYVSMFLDSDTDTSMEINAMAMKYLKDEQLTQLTKLQARNRVLGSKQGAGRHALLQKILRVEDDTSANVTNFGMSPNNMTFATKKYMEKHGLLDGTVGGSSTQTDSTCPDDTYHLRTNYSTMSSGSDGPAQVTREVVMTPRRKSAQNDSATPSRGSRPSNVNSHTATPRNNSRETNSPLYTPKAVRDERNVVNGANYFNTSVPQSHNSSVPQSQNASVPHSSNSTPQSHNVSDPNRGNFGATGRYASPFVTPAPTKPYHSPPERDMASQQSTPQERRYPNEMRGGNATESPGAQYHAPGNQLHKHGANQEEQGVPNHGQARQQFGRRETATIEEDRILDITRLKQLPKLL